MDKNAKLKHLKDLIEMNLRNAKLQLQAAENKRKESCLINPRDEYIRGIIKGSVQTLEQYLELVATFIDSNN